MSRTIAIPYFFSFIYTFLVPILWNWSNQSCIFFCHSAIRSRHMYWFQCPCSHHHGCNPVYQPRITSIVYKAMHKMCDICIIIGIYMTYYHSKCYMSSSIHISVVISQSVYFSRQVYLDLCHLLSTLENSFWQSTELKSGIQCFTADKNGSC